MIEDLIGSYGFPIAVTLILLYDKLKTQAILSKTIDNNTVALTKVYEVMQNCHRAKTI